jgi:hypothetical protein
MNAPEISPRISCGLRRNPHHTYLAKVMHQPLPTTLNGFAVPSQQTTNRQSQL